MASSDPRLILFIGADWWGSDSRALAVAFRKLGHAVVEVNGENYYPIHWTSTPLRILRRSCEGLFARDFNRAIRQHSANRAIDFILVFKGKFVRPGTLREARGCGLPVYCFYPDVSFLDHGPGIWACLPHYDCVFTTKTFHVDDPQVGARVMDLRLVSHGFDPDVHRPLRLSRHGQAAYTCDVSFVGCWSPKKQQILNGLLDQCAGIDLRVWGPGWARATGPVRERWQGRGGYGDELSAIYCSSRINLALLSEPGGGTSVGDQVTARTWQIPASGSFMLHEETAELERYFNPGTETGTFRSPEELAARVREFLEDEAARHQIAAAGYRRCVEQGYTYLPAAEVILAYHQRRLEEDGGQRTEDGGQRTEDRGQRTEVRRPEIRACPTGGESKVQSPKFKVLPPGEEFKGQSPEAKDGQTSAVVLRRTGSPKSEVDPNLVTGVLSRQSNSHDSEGRVTRGPDSLGSRGSGAPGSPSRPDSPGRVLFGEHDAAAPGDLAGPGVRYPNREHTRKRLLCGTDSGAANGT